MTRIFFLIQENSISCLNRKRTLFIVLFIYCLIKTEYDVLYKGTLDISHLQLYITIGTKQTRNCVEAYASFLASTIIMQILT